MSNQVECYEFGSWNKALIRKHVCSLCSALKHEYILSAFTLKFMGSSVLLQSQCSIWKNDVFYTNENSKMVYDDEMGVFKVIIGSDIWTTFKPTQIMGLGTSVKGSLFKKYVVSIRVKFSKGDEYSFNYLTTDEESSTQSKNRIQQLVWADRAAEEAGRLLKTREKVDVNEICEIFRKYRGVPSDLHTGQRFIESCISSGFVAGIFDGKGFVSKYALDREQVRYDIVSTFEISNSGAVVFKCPSCGAGLPLQSKESNGVCKYCNTSFMVPKKILDLI